MHVTSGGRRERWCDRGRERSAPRATRALLGGTVCVCVCVCVERKRAGKSGSERARERECESENEREREQERAGLLCNCPFRARARSLSLAHARSLSRRPLLLCPSPTPQLTTEENKKVVLREGDGLYIPAAFWHYVRSLSPCISVNFWWR